MSDCIKKRSEYAARGIGEYWIIDPQQSQVMLLTLVDGLYEEVVYLKSDRLVSATFPTLELTAQNILQAE
jgi:Uma2 family endonuclease